MGRSPSTISREIRRNSIPLRSGSSGCCRPYAAQVRADARRPRPKPGKMVGTHSCGTTSKSA
ncbi:hypothetical protein ACFXPT_38030 [Streptomyces goshikiensis]|uniref:hypothetical protein n=1 Tax=Streptomyces goshikiensis TaxID=1942 RepID=UPI00368837FF